MGTPSQFLILLCFVPVIQCIFRTPVITLDATADESVWKFVSADKVYSVPASVPGGIYSDLRRNGTLAEDFFWRFNDQEYRWVANTSWSLSRTFTVPSNATNYRHQVLVLHGIDTVAEVYFNGKHVGTCDNMFVRYRFDLRGLLKPGKNSIKVAFESPIIAAFERHRKQAVQYSIPPLCTPKEYNGECHVNYLRKMQASFSWDWGPAFPSVGAWKSITIETYNSTIIRDVIVTTRKYGSSSSSSSWVVNSTVFFETGFSSNSADLNLFVTLERKGNATAKNITNIRIKPTLGEGTANAVLQVPEDAVELWWPNGEGRQELYELTVALADKQQREISLFDTKIGFRTVELIQTPVNVANASQGLSFYLVVNCRPIFAKGSNWIPADILPERGADRSVVSHLLRSARVANMNMLRVWGGGVYESDYFYQLADELGILIWQDMMFACSMYPTDGEFLESVKAEVSQQFRRLQHHASVVVFAGNNENELALRDNWYGTKDNFTVYAKDYVELYVDTIRAAVQSLERSTIFVVASPSNGIESEKEGYIARNPADFRFGDVHIYEYIVDSWNPAVYPVVRFSSEYGFQSLPSLLSYSNVTIPTDLTVGSNFSIRRQHHKGGYEQMIFEMAQHLPVPENFSTIEAFPTLVYYSQINQAMSIKAETEALRRYRDVLTEDGRGLTMGALYWQLNDVWQAPSWSSIEYDGRWKMLHYFSRKFFSPVLVSPVLEQDELRVVLVSDLQNNLNASLLNTTVYKWDSFIPVFQTTAEVIVKKSGTTLGAAFSLSSLFNTSLCGPKENCVAFFQLSCPNGVWKSDNFFFPVSPKHANMKNASLEVISVEGPVKSSEELSYEFSIKIKSDYPTPFVWLETPIKGHFSDNGFLLVTPNMTLKYFTDASITNEVLRSSLVLRSLNSINTY